MPLLFLNLILCQNPNWTWSGKKTKKTISNVFPPHGTYYSRGGFLMLQGGKKKKDNFQSFFFGK